MLVLIVLLLVTVGLAVAPGVALFAIVPGLILLAYAVWIGLGFTTRRTPASAVRRSGRRGPELLGPGGPDDPDA
jgi:hypothetical protein